MARRTAKQKKKEARIAALLGGLLALALLTAVLWQVPGAEAWLQQALGIQRTVELPPVASSDTAIHFIDVGQGDAVLVQQNGEYALVDAGPPEGREALLDYLRSAGVDRLRYVFMTHPHADHIGGMLEVLKTYPTDLVVLPEFSLAPYPTSKTFQTLLEYLVETQLSTQTAEVGAVYALGEGSFTVLQAGMEADNLNLLSLVMLFEAGGLRYLSSGDAEKQNEAALAASGYTLAAQVFKAGHHGSSTSNTYDLLSLVNPGIVVVCCATGNSYGHPHREALDTFEAVGATVLRTDIHSHIVVAPDGEGGVAYAVATQQE